MEETARGKTIILSHSKGDAISPLIQQNLSKKGNVIIMPNDDDNLGILLAQKLKIHGMMISSTDTIPGFLCFFDDPEKIKMIYNIKKRNSRKKLLILASSVQMALSFCPKKWLTPQRKKFCRSIWPNPVTLILPLEPAYQPLFYPYERNIISDNDLDAKLTYAVRVPDLGWLRVLIDEIGKPLVAPSANISGSRISSDPMEIIETFYQKIEMFHFSYRELIYKNQGSTGDLKDNVLIASTLVNISGSLPQIIRAGKFNQERIRVLWTEAEIN